MATNRKPGNYAGVPDGPGPEADGGKPPPDGDAGSVRLQRDVGLVHAIGVASGTMIGSGIFVSPVSIIYYSGSVGAALVIWVLSGILTLFVALPYCELAAMFPATGAEYAYYKNTIGNLPAFLYAWFMSLWALPAVLALLSLTTSIYIFEPFFMTCDAQMVSVRLVAILVLFLMSYLNCVYVKYVTRVQTLLTVVKYLALVGIVIMGFVHMGRGHTELIAKGFEGTSRNAENLAIAMYSGVFTYNGWQCMFSIMEEIRDPQKIIPRSTGISFVLVIGIYVAANIAYLAVLTPAEMLSSEAVAVTFAEKLIGKYSAIIPFFVACSTVGSLNGTMLGGTRIYFAAARDRMFPGALSMISSKYKTPMPAIIVTGILTTIYILSGDALTILEYLGFAMLLISFCALVCVLYLRYKDPHRHRPIKVNIIIPIIALVCCGALMLLGLYKDPVKNSIGILVVVSGIPVYWICVAWGQRPKKFDEAIDNAGIVMQKLLLVIPSDKEEEETVAPESKDASS